MLLYPTKHCLSAVCDARTLISCRTEPIGAEHDIIFYRAVIEADVGFPRPALITGLCVSGHNGGPLRNLPPEVLDVFDCDLCFDRLPRQIRVRLST